MKRSRTAEAHDARVVRAAVELLERRVFLTSVSGTVYNDVNDELMMVPGDSGIAGAMVYLDTNHNGVLDTKPVSAASTKAIKIGPGAQGSSALSVKGLTGVVVNLTVTINISEEHDSALTVTLTDAAGASIPLVQGAGGTGSNFVGTTFNDNAPTPIAQGSAPFSSIADYQPTKPLSTFAGSNGNGQWTLHVSDASGAPSAVLQGWSLNLNEAAEPTVVTGPTGQYSFNNLPTASTFQVGVVLPTGWSPTTLTNTTFDANTQYADFGAMQPMIIDGTTFEDTNGNGVHDPGESALPDRSFYIDSNNNGRFDFDATPVKYSYTGREEIPVPSSGVVTLPITVSGRYPSLTDVTTSLKILGAGTDALTAFLVSPTGTQVALFTLSPGRGTVNATFSDAASMPVESATGPLNGTYRPYSLNKLSAFQGENPNGTWDLVIDVAKKGDGNGAMCAKELEVSGSVSLNSSEQQSSLVNNPILLDDSIEPDSASGQGLSWRPSERPARPCIPGHKCMPAFLPVALVGSVGTGFTTDIAATVASDPFNTTARVLEVEAQSGGSPSITYGVATPASIRGYVYQVYPSLTTYPASGVTVFLDRNGDGKLDPPVIHTSLATPDQAITDGALIASNQTTDITGNGLVVGVAVEVDLSPSPGKTTLTYALTSPAGRVVPLVASGDFLVAKSGYSLSGENPNGVWTLQVSGPSSYTGTLVNWKLALQTGDPTMTTGSDGSYAFTGLDLNNPYVVDAVPPASEFQSTPPSAITLTSGEAVTGNNIDLEPTMTTTTVSVGQTTIPPADTDTTGSTDSTIDTPELTGSTA